MASAEASWSGNAVGHATAAFSSGSFGPIPLAAGLGEYPGRGLVVGALDDGHPFLAYFATGRSQDSLRRHAVSRPDGSVAIEPINGEADDELRHYVAISPAAKAWVVGNGAHVEDMTAAGVDELWPRFRAWAPEPDPPIWTPRIVAAITPERSPRLVVASTRRRHVGEGTEHVLLASEEAPAGLGVRVATYRGAVEDPHPDGQPQWVRTGADIEDVAHGLWEQLPDELRVLLVARDLESGAAVSIDRRSLNA